MRWHWRAGIAGEMLYSSVSGCNVVHWMRVMKTAVLEEPVSFNWIGYFEMASRLSSKEARSLESGAIIRCTRLV